MYIKVIPDSYCWQHGLFAANNKMICISDNVWTTKQKAVRAARKLAKRISVDYREEN